MQVKKTPRTRIKQATQLNLSKNKQCKDEIYFSRKFLDHNKPKIQTNSFRVKLNSLQRPPKIGNSTGNIFISDRAHLKHDDVKLNIST